MKNLYRYNFIFLNVFFSTQQTSNLFCFQLLIFFENIQSKKKGASLFSGWGRGAVRKIYYIKKLIYSLKKLILAGNMGTDSITKP
jgi:hypothetical protein